MEYFLFLVAFIILIVIIATNHNKTKEQSQKIILLLSKMLEEQKRIAKELNELKENASKSSYTAPSTFAKPETPPLPVEEEKPILKETPKPDWDTYKREEAIPTPLSAEPIKVPAKEEAILQTHAANTAAEPIYKTFKVKTPAPPRPSFWERNPDLEKFIGENLINKIGIAILVIGIGFFVKFAIDQEWINEIGRVAIGIACGGILIGIAHKLREKFKAFSSVLIGGGLAVLYITIAIAFHDYKIFTQTVSFVIMVLITCFAVFVSIVYNRQELAIISFIGGFISPIMLSTGEGNYIVLFTYIIVLNVGMLSLAYLRSWKILNSVAYGFTVLLFGGWLVKQVSEDKLPHLGALLFASAFYIIFFLMNIVNNIKEQKKFVIGEIMMLLSNTILYYSAGMYILHEVEQGMYQGLFTVLVALFNLVFAYTLFRSKKVDSNVLYLLIGLVLSFASLAAPVQLEGNYITLFWAIETGLLLWLSQKSGIQLIKLASFAVMALMWVSLCMDWFNVYIYPSESNPPHALFLNKGLITTLVSAAAVAGFIFFLRKEEAKIYHIQTSIIDLILKVAFVAILYIGLFAEVDYQIGYRIDLYEAQKVYLGIYNLAFISALTFYLHKQKQEVPNLLSVLIFALSCIVYIFNYNIRVAEVRNTFLMGSTSGIHYYFHYLLLGLFISIIAQVHLLVFRQKAFLSKYTAVFNWVFCFLLLYILSAEIEHLIVVSSYIPPDYTSIGDAKKLAFKIIFPILWGLCSFGFMYFGMNKKVKTIRIISLVVFSITLLKLFIFDVSEMSEGGKIAAFISLGVLLLVISFMYQRLKKIIVDDEQKTVQ